MLKVTLLVNDEKYGKIKGNVNVIPNTTEIYTAIPNDGYHFIKWSDNNTDNPREITVTKDYNLTATFEQHISEPINKPVTCTEDGLKDGSKCSVCGVILKEPETIKALGHTYGDPTFIWTEDKTSVEGVIVCENDKSHTLSGGSKEISTDTTKATCTEKGKIVYSATVEINGTKYTPKETVEIPALGHSYGAPVFTWTEFSKAVATFTCVNDGDKQNIDCNITSDTTIVPTIEKEGEIKYTATATFNGKPYTDTKTSPIEKLKPQGGDDPTPTHEISQNSQYKVWGYNGVVYIETEITDSQVNIFDLNGRLIKSQSLTNSHTEITINKKGVVVVVIDNISYKVVL